MRDKNDILSDHNISSQHILCLARVLSHKIIYIKQTLREKQQQQQQQMFRKRIRVKRTINRILVKIILTFHNVSHKLGRDDTVFA